MSRFVPWLTTLSLLLACTPTGPVDAGKTADAGGGAPADAGEDDEMDAGACGAGACSTDGGQVGDGDGDAPDAGIDSEDAGLPDSGDGGPLGDGGDGDPDPCASLQDAFETVASPPAMPPYAGTVWFDPDIITDDDETAFVGVTYVGQAERLMFDRRTAAFETYNAHLFDAQFGSTVTVEIQVNPEFNQADAQAEATTIGTALGRLPAFLFEDLQTVWIHAGVELWGGGNNNLLVHTGQAAAYALDGVTEEVMLHELAHTSLDDDHAEAALWTAAQAADGVALSTYARDFPDREDVAETLGPWLATRFRPGRITPALAASVTDTIPNRVRYLDCQGFSMDLVP